LENALAAAAAAAATEDGFSPPGAADGNISGIAEESLPLMTGGDRERVRPPRRLIVVVRGAAAPGTEAVDGGRLVLIAIGIVAVLLEIHEDLHSLWLDVRRLRLWFAAEVLDGSIGTEEPHTSRPLIFCDVVFAAPSSQKLFSLTLTNAMRIAIQYSNNASNRGQSHGIKFKATAEAFFHRSLR
jgi:hypothetical protein